MNHWQETKQCWIYAASRTRSAPGKIKAEVFPEVASAELMQTIGRDVLGPRDGSPHLTPHTRGYLQAQRPNTQLVSTLHLW